jgi:hypothetical protein
MGNLVQSLECKVPKAQAPERDVRYVLSVHLDVRAISMQFQIRINTGRRIQILSRGWYRATGKGQQQYHNS